MLGVMMVIKNMVVDGRKPVLFQQSHILWIQTSFALK